MTKKSLERGNEIQRELSGLNIKLKHIKNTCEREFMVKFIPPMFVEKTVYTVESTAMNKLLYDIVVKDLEEKIDKLEKEFKGL